MNGCRTAVRVVWKAALAARAGTALALTLIGLPVAAFVAIGLPETGSDGRFWWGVPGSLLEAGFLLPTDSLLVLLVSLLAAPAFALDAPRLRRLRTLIAETGEEALRPRTVVLASGPLLGAVAGLLGTLAGFGLALLSGAPLTAVLSWDVPGLAIALAVISGSAAARLAAGRGGRRYRVRLTLGGLLVGGGALALSLCFLLLPDADSAVLTATTGMWSFLIGFALLVPATVALAGRFAGRLPQPLRQAVQDAARHRGRTASGVSAAFLVAAVFATVATAATSYLESERLTYDQWLPVGNTMVYGMSAETAPEVLAAVEREFPGVPMTQIDEFHERQQEQEQDGRWFDYVGTGGRCDDDSCDSSPWESIDFVVADPETVRFLVGNQPEVVSALAAGKVVTYLPDVVHNDGTARFESSRFSAAEPQPVVERTFSFPAVYATSSIDRVPDVIFPRQVVVGTGLKIEPGLLLTDTPFSEEQFERLDRAVAEITDSEVRAYTEPGFDDSDALSLRVPGAVTSVLVLVAALIAAWRAAAGAGPRVRRRTAAPQAGFIALLGCGLSLLAGIPLGLVVASLLPRLNPIPGEEYVIAFDVPWLPLLGGGVAVSLLATMLMAVLTLARPRRADVEDRRNLKDDRPRTHRG
ncbi:hypothetical protein ABGB12_05730 [Actinocorallia sp. B10E7]|uniref:hypothetical protein n=1 Tax=Actinocorallia sp. B10E7 TaxID=3153558 RepID=UPI00325D8F9D